ncbi:hypothetical protein VTJ49DRAFT_3680 [Mycothermus thermophilus]|uniref:Uncharacterized protein n=1 Tax=Humicola insolens TaxID=85995 RepID=A0ABR3V8U9_HUMIN
MATEGPVEPGAPNLNLTPEEKRVYGQLFRQADSDNVGVVTGDVAVKFFEKTRLDSRILGEIWQIADQENRGFLTPSGFGVALRLIGHAQAGREPVPELALQPGPLPKFEGINITPAPPPPPPPALQAQTTGAPGPIRIPPLTPEKVAQYAGLFERQNLQGNLLPGEAAKQIFEKSGLPNDVLGRIWMLADTEQRGALVLTEFVIAMHLLTSIKTGALRALPTILPAALYEAATRRPHVGASLPRQQSPTTAAPVIPPVPAIPKQFSGQAPLQQMRTGSPLGRPPIAAQTTGDWLVTPGDKARFDQLFDDLDKSKKGFITGEEAVPFFSQSNLSEEVLAQIWDLADIRSEGRLNRDEFAVAMYLIRQQRTKREQLPATLPPALMPPSMRPQRPATAVASAFDAPPPPRPQPPPQKPSALDDLFGLDDVTQAAAPAQVPVATGGSAGGDPFAASVSPVPSSPPRTSPAPATTTFKPFVPSSSFGRGLAAQNTGASSSSAPAKPVGADDDLLGDADPEISKKLTNETTELANLSNQIGSLTKQVQDVQQQRTATQNELNQSSAQKKTFEQRLAQLRAMYEKEAQDVRALETQLATSKAETKKLQAEYAMVDASYQDLQNQHRQVLAALQADQQENAALKEKIRVVNGEIAQLKPQIEKLKSEARQQKGLVAINKKQLATNEAERDRLKNEVEDLTRSHEELARQISSSPPPPPAQVASPTLSTSSSANNPFFRRTGSTDVTAATNTFSAPIRSFTDKTFDDVFGPSPVFRQNTGASSGSAASFATPASTSSPNASRQPTVVASESATLAETVRPSSSGFGPFGGDTAAESLSTSRQVSPPLSRTESGQQEATTAPALEPAQTGQSLASGSGSDARAASPASAAESGKVAFGSIAKESTPAPAPVPTVDPFSVDQDSKAKEDFELAFASFKRAREAAPSPAAASGNNNGAPTTAAGVHDAAAKAFARFDTEFPPITELERAEESDSESEKGGFEDDFAPASTPQAVGSGKAVEGSRAASPVAVAKTSPTLAKKELGVGSSSSSPPPTAAGVAAATEAVSERAPSAPVPTVSSATNLGNLSSSHVDDIFGSSSNAQPTTTSSSSRPTTATATPAPPATAATATTSNNKAPFDDFDDEFEGLEDAREGSADDEFGTRSGFVDDFNPVFDSSPPPSQPKPDTASAATTNTSGGGAPVFGTEASFDFASLSGGSVAGSQTGQGVESAVGSGTEVGNGDVSGERAGQQHDWDALFAGLDSATPTPAAQGLGLGQSENDKEGTGDSTSKTEETAAVAGGSSDEDPVVKLTRMGYSRKEAVAALERCEDNLERENLDEEKKKSSNMADDGIAIYDEVEIEDMTYDETLQIFHYPCPCGDRFEIAIQDLQDGEDIAVCPSCSLMIRVIFDVDNLPKPPKPASEAASVVA